MAKALTGRASPAMMKRVRKICLSLPDTTGKRAWGETTFRVRGKMFAMFDNNHHDEGRIALWCNCTLADQALLIATHPTRCFVPPYVGVKGWVGVRIDSRANWRLASDVIEGAYRLTLDGGARRPRVGRRT